MSLREQSTAMCGSCRLLWKYLELLNGLLGTSLLLTGAVYRLPGLLNLLLKSRDSALVILTKLEGGLYLSRIRDNLCGTEELDSKHLSMVFNYPTVLQSTARASYRS